MKIRLNNGVALPQLGYGVFQITNLAQCEQCVTTALQAGYRLFDTAADYENESAVGKAIKKSTISRKEIFISSKVWITHDGYKETMSSFAKTLENLQTDYIDLYLIHMPYGDYYNSWQAMNELYCSGKVRAIGVCNFLPDRLADLILTSEIVPVVDQVEFHPFYQQKELRNLLAKYRITPMAWAPFAEGKNHLFTNPVLKQIGQQYGKTPAQVTLRWLRQSGAIAIPKSVHQERMQENFAIDDFDLSSTDMKEIDQLDTKKPLILTVNSLSETYRLHNISYHQ